jgi:hypothetical protein
MRAVDSATAAEILKRFGAYGVEVGLVSPTATALDKSIMDATAPLRDFLKASGLHDFSTQEQGPEHKRVLDGSFVTSSGTIATKVSLYRPTTKSGDPRIWFSGLKAYASGGHVLALLVVRGKLYIANTSDLGVMKGLDDPRSTIASILDAASSALSPAATELLRKLREISERGFIRTVRSGDTGVGATLENLLGIASNSRKTPDYRGIEIKASRHASNRKQAKNRVNLFSQVPNWRHSSSKPARTVLGEHGYLVDGRKQLYCTVGATAPNSQDLALSLDLSEELLSVVLRAETDTPLMVWQMSRLRGRLEEKHPESFWVKAESKLISGVEHFHYHTVVHTAKPLIGNFSQAIADGIVTLDLTMSEKGLKGVRDHGYLFKIWPEDLTAIFPTPKTHRLQRAAALQDPVDETTEEVSA